MRERLQTLRQDVVRAIAACETPRDFSFIGRQKGLFSMLGITPQQVRQLRNFRWPNRRESTSPAVQTLLRLLRQPST